MTEQIQLLGNRINCFESHRELYDKVLADTRQQIGGYVTVNNVHTMMEGFHHPDYQKIINNSYLSIPDGKPLQIMGKLKGKKKTARLFGPTVMENFIDWGRADQASHFFFGSSDDTLQKLRLAIEEKYPGTIIAGMVAPPYAPSDQWDNDAFIREMNAAKADFIWIGLGAPKQERWMHQHNSKINRGILFGIGAGFDYMAGNTMHAPQWMKDMSLEWFYRLSQEPGRLWKRYLTTIPPFLLLACFELAGFSLKKGNKKN